MAPIRPWRRRGLGFRLIGSGLVIGGVVVGLGLMRERGWVGWPGVAWARPVMGGSVALALPDSVPIERIDFGKAGITGWTSLAGRWDVEAMPDAPNGARALVQRAVGNAFNVIVAPGESYTDVDVSVRFKPIAGREERSTFEWIPARAGALASAWRPAVNVTHEAALTSRRVSDGPGVPATQRRRPR
jgi:hypothetical protein